MAPVRRFLVPVYIVLAMLLGGSAQGVWRNLVLQLLAIALIAAAVVAQRRERLSTASRSLVALLIGAVGLIVLQLIPIPPALWASLPGREIVREGFTLRGEALPWLPLSLAPYATLATALALLPPVAVLVAMLRFGIRERLLSAVVLVGVLANLVLGAAQAGSGGDRLSLYDLANTGAVGFFANRNHLGTLLLFAIPFSVALFASLRATSRERGRAAGLAAIGGGAFVLILLGLVLNGSLAAFALAVPVIAASALVLPNSWRFRSLAGPLAVLIMIIAVAAMATSPIQQDWAQGSGSASVQSRGEIWGKTAEAIAANFPVGSGLGTFPAVYRLHENPLEVGSTFVNHAHNEYLELALETGILGMLLLLGFLVWWGATALRIWRSPLSSRFARAATIASAAMLAHSIVDYPLRNAALASLFAASLALMAQPSRRLRTSDPSEVRPTKHLVIG